jgi:hypothetical protein
MYSGESTSIWCVIDKDATSSDTKPIPLPKWFQVPVDRSISIWRAEKNEWDAKRTKRFETKKTYVLTKATEEKYQVRDLFAEKRKHILNVCNGFYIYI